MSLNYNRLILCSVMLWVSHPVFADASRCYAIQNSDQKNYCLAYAKNQKSYCYSIRENDSKQFCLAELSQQKSYCYSIRLSDEKNKCLAKVR